MSNTRSSNQQTHKRASVSTRVGKLLAQMTLAEKIGQMAQVDKNSIAQADVAQLGIGSVLSGGGGNPPNNNPAAWRDMVHSFIAPSLESRLGIPLIYGVDAVHGHGTLRGATVFPHNVGLGATGNADLVERIGRITAREVAATGVRWNFAPALSVAQDIRWGRTFESFSENSDLVSRLGAAYVRGLHGEKLDQPDAVLASAKHYVADGGTRWGSTTPGYEWIPGVWQQQDGRFSIDQGNADIDEATLRAIHLPPYQAAIAAGVRNVMVSYSSWGGLKMHAHHYLLTTVLKGELGFEGFLVTDWMAIDQLSPDYDTCVATAVNAGLDMIMIPYDYRRFIASLTRVVERGVVPIARIDDAVSRILHVKFELGLFEQPFADASLLPQVGSEAHRAVAREAVQKSLVLLKNEGQTLPLVKTTPTILVAGPAADDVGLLCGGWTIEWMGKAGAVTPGTTILQGIRQAAGAGHVFYDENGHFPAIEQGQESIGIVVLNEGLYVEGMGDRPDLHLPAAQIELLERMRSLCRQVVVVLISGRPLIITEQLPLADAWVAAWYPGTEGNGVADVLFGDVPFCGRLSFTWPRSMHQLPLGTGEGEPLFPLGYGLETNV